MKRTIILMMVLACLSGCTSTKNRTGLKSPERAAMDSTIENRKRTQHKFSMHYAAIKMYRMHEPDCELCRQMRKRETEAIVDSMLREYGIVSKEDKNE